MNHVGKHIAHQNVLFSLEASSVETLNAAVLIKQPGCYCSIYILWDLKDQ